MNLSMKIQCFRFNENTILRQNKKKITSSKPTPLLHLFSRSKKRKKKQIRKNKKREERKRDVEWKPILAKQRQTGENDA